VTSGEFDRANLEALRKQMPDFLSGDSTSSAADSTQPTSK
jgi:hypothetical protein